MCANRNEVDFKAGQVMLYVSELHLIYMTFLNGSCSASFESTDANAL